jgi:hypothetical protein
MIRNTIEFYNILTSVIRSWPESSENEKYNRHRRINTFAAIPVRSGQNSHNLEKDSRYKNQTYFFSRKWENSGYRDSELSYDYPSLICVESRDEITRPFSSAMEKRANLAFFLCDLMPQKNSMPTRHEELRTFEQVGSDLRSLIDELITELSNFCYGQYNDGSGFSSNQWYSLDWCIRNSYDYRIIKKLPSYIKSQKIEITPSYGYWGDNLAEFAFQLEIKLDPCERVEFEYENNNIKKLPDV